jgi:hypothetical protein
MAERDYPYQVIAGPRIETEADHFLRCPTCGTWIDCRRLGEVLEHEKWCACGEHSTPKPGKLIH